MSGFASSWRQAVPRPNGIKEHVRGLLRRVALDAMSLLPGPQPARFLRGLYCHYVFDDQRAAFERIITDLCRIGSFIDTPTFMAMLEGRQPIDGRYFHLSFDDGFRNVYTNAVPVLSRLGVPAIAFVPSCVIGAEYEATKRYSLDTTQYAGIIEMMSWDDLKRMVAAGFEVGSHSRTHARLADVSADPARLQDEVIGSRLDIERELGVPCRYIAWPFGRITDVDGAALATVERGGYEGCFGAFRGSITPGGTDRFRIPRHQFEAQWPLRHVRYFAAGNMEFSETKRREISSQLLK